VVEFGPINASIHKVDECVGWPTSTPLKNIYRRTLERCWHELIELVERAAARLDEARRELRPRHHQCLRRGRLAGAVAPGMPLDALDDVAEREVDDAETGRRRRAGRPAHQTRKPAAYLTGEAWLQGVPFHVDERVIVPRSLIAEVLAEGSTLDAWLSDRTRRVLDLCTGNGSLAVLAALAWPEATVDAADLSADALAVARLNVDRHQLADRITLHSATALAACAAPTT
jgi:ribosomal protein L3 glutamine methyltransferase